MSDPVKIDHSQSHNATSLPAILRMYKEEVYTDCHLEVGMKKIACHRLVLGIRSPVLHAMLTSGMTESQTRTIPMPLFNAEIVEAIVE